MSIKNFNTWLLTEQEAPASTPPPPTPAPPIGGDFGSREPAATGAAPKPKQIRAVLIKHPISKIESGPEENAKQFNEYVFTTDDVTNWINGEGAQADSVSLLKYLEGHDIKLTDIHKKFAQALKDDRLGAPISTIDIQFTRDGSPMTKDIGLVFLA